MLNNSPNTFITHGPKRDQGFTLIEVLIALMVFALGVLGIALYSGNALKVASTNMGRAQALNDASQAMSSFYTAAYASPASFKTALDAFDDNDDDDYAFTRTVASGGGSVLVQITAAQDSSATPNDLLTTSSSSWVSPLQVGVTVTFEGGDDSDLSNDLSARTAYTFLLRSS